jgi:thiol-disulfide isomerase/thioredoxin
MPRTQRIDRKSLDMIMNGEVNEKHSVVIKFYSAQCHMCHALAPIYKRISDEHEDVTFYVYNTYHDGEELEAKYGFEGVPTICFVRTEGENTRIKFLPDAEEPNSLTWYYEDQIHTFIERYKHTQTKRS